MVQTHHGQRQLRRQLRWNPEVLGKVYVSLLKVLVLVSRGMPLGQARLLVHSFESVDPPTLELNSCPQLYDLRTELTGYHCHDHLNLDTL